MPLLFLGEFSLLRVVVLLDEPLPLRFEPHSLYLLDSHAERRTFDLLLAPVRVKMESEINISRPNVAPAGLFFKCLIYG